MLNRKMAKELIENISKIIVIDEFNLFFKIFLIKEIIIKCKEQTSYDFEISVIKILNNNET